MKERERETGRAKREGGWAGDDEKKEEEEERHSFL